MTLDIRIDPSPTPTVAPIAPALHLRGLEVALADHRGRGSRSPAPRRRTLVRVDELVVAPGQCVGLVGESGSGKTLTAMAVAGLLPSEITATADRIEVAGTDVVALRPADARRHRAAHIGVVFQNPTSSLNPRLRVWTQLAESFALDLSRAQRRERAAELLSLVGIVDVAKTLAAFPHELSGGLNQRVMIAIALAREPRLLIADEPTTALDVSVQKVVLDLIDDLRARLDLGVLLVSHDIGVIADRTDTVHVMAEGAVVESGPTDEVLGNPARDYTRRLLAAVPHRLARRTFVAPPATVLDRGGDRADAGEVLVEVRGVHRAFRDRSSFRRTHVALDDVDLTVRRGAAVGIVGESGSGKTTLARIVVGLDDPDRGTVRFAGDDPRALAASARRAWRRDVQYVFQDPYSSLDPRLTVAQSLSEPLRLHRLGHDRRGIDRRIDELLDDVELARAHRDRLPWELSGGQRQRVGIARALASSPRLIVADEPVSALDLSVQARVLLLLERLRHEHGLTYLFISHDLGVVRFLCDEVVVLRHGRVVEEGATTDVLARPQHPYTQALIDAMPGRTLA